jgi:hypothetical protein
MNRPDSDPRTQRPESREHAPHHLHYLELVDGPVLEVLKHQRHEVERRLLAIGENDGGYRYAPEKWTVREAIGHLSDAERVYGYRALIFARGHAIDAPKYDPDGYVATAGFDSRTIASLVAEWVALRESTIAFFENLPLDAWTRIGTMGGQPLSVRALAFIAAGHVRQHLDVLRERYGVIR